MKAHLVFAHPNLQSFNGQMRNTAVETLNHKGFQVSVSDLYQIKFKASADEGDFTALYNPSFLMFKQNKQWHCNIILLQTTLKENINF